MKNSKNNNIILGLKDRACSLSFRPRTRPKTLLQCFALEQSLVSSFMYLVSVDAKGTLRTFKGEDTKQLVSSLGDLSLCSCCYTSPSCLAGLDS